MIHGKYVEAKPIIMKQLAKCVHVIYLCGGRGIGKTYGALDYCRELGMQVEDALIDKTNPELNKFIYLRRTAVEAETVASPETCPFKKYNINEGYNINADFLSKLGFGNFYLDKERTKHIGYCAALSTFANLRGVDFADCSLLLYDECIPENKNKHPLKDEGFLFLDMLETINRNRALEGLQEIVVLLLSNPIDLANPFLSQLKLTPILNSMIFKNQQRYTDRSRSLHIERFKDHPVSKEKEEKSFLYKFAKGTGFNERSLSGDFVDNDLSKIKKVPLSEYSPYLNVENVTVYKHKSSDIYYISKIFNKAKFSFSAFEKEKIRAVFYWMYKLLVVEGKVYYDDYNTKVVFESMINYKPL